ncbi:hypothetical protein CYMTET_37042 [Cymbomonas tetramitiformis]|uniref:Uncharacterized protein n=1 Tax=Cymbomonas tetramitiformis TaxID=36881 RepID=A0AAE0CH49_9CHLO|nr:hypothetical protein CYMTET_37042 [Cymbomonas tetramitiformis]
MNTNEHGAPYHLCERCLRGVENRKRSMSDAVTSSRAAFRVGGCVDHASGGVFKIRNRRNSTSGARLRFRAKLGSETALGAALVDTNMLPMYGGAPPGEKTLHRPVAREWTTRGMAELAARIQASLPIASARAPQEDTFDSDSDSGSSSSDDNGRTTALEDVVTIAIKAIA